MKPDSSPRKGARDGSEGERSGSDREGFQEFLRRRTSNEDQEQLSDRVLFKKFLDKKDRYRSGMQKHRNALDK